MSEWEIEGAAGERIFGTAHEPEGDPRGVVLIAHGFLGYKDYGMFPRLASALCERGFLAHRFNFSHSGMTEELETFERPDLFERDTLQKHQEDLDCVIDAIGDRRIAGRGLSMALLGHSRGGVDVLLCAGRRFGEGLTPLPRAVVTLASPDATCLWDEASRREVLERGFAEIKSNRTGQTLRIDAGWLREQLDDPEAHDVLGHVSRIECPLLVIHGEVDPTVPAACAKAIAGGAGERAKLVVIEGGDHVFNTVNPMGEDEPASKQLSEVIGSIGGFLNQHLGA